jgi:hypothetical protein
MGWTLLLASIICLPGCMWDPLFSGLSLWMGICWATAGTLINYCFQKSLGVLFPLLNVPQLGIRRWLGNFLTWYAIQLFTQCQQHRAHLFPFIFHASQTFSYDIPQLEDYNFWHNSCVVTWKFLQSLLRLANPFNFPI